MSTSSRPHPNQLRPETSQSDAVTLHLWQAVQVTVDLALSWCVRAGLGAPPTYADGFRKLAIVGLLPTDLAFRLVSAVGFRNLLVQAYADLDLERVHAAASSGPTDLRSFVAAILLSQTDREREAPG